MRLLIKDWIQMSYLPIGWSLWALKQMEELGGSLAPDYFQRAIELYQKAWESDGLWKTMKAQGIEHTRPKIKAFDPHMDLVLGSTHQALKRFMKTFPLGSDRHQKAKTLKETFFPEGARKITSLPVAEKVVVVENMIEKMTQTPFSESLAALGLNIWLEELQAFFPNYKDSVENDLVYEIQYADVLQARREAKEGAALLVAELLSITAPQPEERGTIEQMLNLYDKEAQRYKQLLQQRKSKAQEKPDLNPEDGSVTPLSIPESLEIK